MKISVCIITLNEEANLPRCLASVRRLADEVVVVDSGSTDRTVAIAQEMEARVVEQPWLGYVGQKNFALTRTSHEWVLSLDADEALDEELIEAIVRLKTQAISDEVSGFSMSRVVWFEGRWIRFGDWYPDVLVRLFRKNRARFCGKRVHERLEITGRVKRLPGELAHFSFEDEADYRRRMEYYAELWALSAWDEGCRAGALTMWSRSLARFFRGWLIKGGWKGGWLGFRLAWLGAREVFLKYDRLRQLSASKTET